MSLITRCPSCETLFKVVPDQLRVSEGWVRCGQCSDIFDAALHLLPVTSASQVPQAQQMELPDALTGLDAADSPVLDGTRFDEVLSVPAASVPELEELDDSNPRVEALDISLLAVSTVKGPGFAAEEDGSSDEPEPEPEPEVAEASFLQRHEESPVWRKPIMRVTLALLSLVLLLGLLGQMVLHERDRIVALEPGLRPLLLAICAPLNCVLSPLRRLDSIVIDSSSFARIEGDAYRLNFTVKNTADTPLALPAVELTLTDLTDQPVLRRVLLPAELGVKSDSLAAGAEWPISLPLAIKAGSAPEQIAGYRLLIFYP
ncbi:MAG: DUF3426 domain-containing protein [Gammaproteobacteria bacterium]|uniref:zinc-ribbon and DUF3426 domain-containing protein n=1 Tax=Rhodoferax sp. TaxID=50421 RepID=UPI0017E5E158|nr:zinc-ribbon and DUF3426 domain-containing protein [Rhodoferax sp.]MBU3898019.1 DUF3426 domain-containing protein [Gammaproteobacteria bacterium]MBA3058101.1 DUF3426 domain-containing protein [Rhodoferax sp.]MBU3995968.1 DUF3426 domain-containing protein [Gammaproteobacteria bacterium]MBU4078972.1 DUF3426 domain-containing protein [Gammaproteobacteria bacterium]MBU4114557.1 DUF3426 domain-containing protein [Gammaproteobacteria bacterium]